MPYEVKQFGSQWIVVKKLGGKIMGRHKTKQEAQAQLKALYANE